MSRYEARFESTALGAVARASRKLNSARDRRRAVAPAYFRARDAEERWVERRRREILKARALGCSVRAVAEAAGLDPGHVSRIERGERT